MFGEGPLTGRLKSNEVIAGPSSNGTVLTSRGQDTQRDREGPWGPQREAGVSRVCGTCAAWPPDTQKPPDSEPRADGLRQALGCPPGPGLCPASAQRALGADSPGLLLALYTPTSSARTAHWLPTKQLPSGSHRIPVATVPRGAEAQASSCAPTAPGPERVPAPSGRHACPPGSPARLAGSRPLLPVQLLLGVPDGQHGLVQRLQPPGLLPAPRARALAAWGARGDTQGKGEWRMSWDVGGQ